MENIKKQLRKKISNRNLAKQLDLSPATINAILNNKYTGSKDTEIKVRNYIKLLLIDKPDLNHIIYSNADLFIRALYHAVRTLKIFTDDEAHIMLDVNLKLKKFKKAQNEK